MDCDRQRTASSYFSQYQSQIIAAPWCKAVSSLFFFLLNSSEANDFQISKQKFKHETLYIENSNLIVIFYDFSEYSHETKKYM